jgi:hypothetical protein
MSILTTSEKLDSDKRAVLKSETGAAVNTAPEARGPSRGAEDRLSDFASVMRRVEQECYAES